MMNKAFELIEAHYLFGVGSSELGVEVHPQSIVHGIVEMIDGTRLLHASPPSMEHPISYALHFPGIEQEHEEQRRDRVGSKNAEAWEFSPIDLNRFSAVRMAYDLIDQNTNSSNSVNTGAMLRFYTANEIAADAFFNEKLPFMKIVPFIDKSLNDLPLLGKVPYSDIFSAIDEERALLLEFMKSF